MRFAFLVGGVLLLATACGGGTSATTRPSGAPASLTPPASAPASVAAACTGSGGSDVSIAEFLFNPASVTVSVGGTATWTNDDTTTHTVTFDQGPDCGRLSRGATVSRTFDAAGTFAYHCAIHPSMKGTVVVQ